MAMKKTIGKGASPVETPATLAGVEAREFRFEAASVAHVIVKLKKGHKPVTKDLPDSLPAGSGFTPDRLVINLGVVDDANAPVTRFSPKFELRVRYLPEDVTSAGGSESDLKLAYRDGSQWVILSAADHNFRLERSTSFAAAELSDFPSDPPIAVGH